MKDLQRLKVVAFTADRVPNDHPGGELPWQAYHAVRNAVVRACRRHGPTGPMGECRLVEGGEQPDVRTWERGDDNPTYFVIDDQLNDERYLYAELYGDDPFHPGWLMSVVEALRTYPGWGLGINNIPDSYVLVFGNKLMVKGSAFAGCRDAASVVEAVRRQLRRSRKAWWEFWK